MCRKSAFTVVVNIIFKETELKKVHMSTGRRVFIVVINSI